jgi:hypothetical protein
MRLNRKHGTVWIAASLMLVAAEARASNAGKHDDESLAKAADMAPGTAGASVASDRGKLRAITREEAQILLQGVSRFVDQSSDGLQTVRHESGALSIYLDDRFQSVSMARLSADGKPVVRCVTTKDEARQFLANRPTSSPARAKKASKRARVTTEASRTAAPSVATTTTTTAALEEK